MADRAHRFGSLVRDGRGAKGLSQEALADQLGISQPSLSAWERGDAAPTPSNLYALTRILGIPADELLAALVDEPGEAVPA